VTHAENFRRTLWSDLTPPRAPLPAALSGKADVLIVGGGLLGLSTALTLAEGGADVALLEASEIGFGASGRNSGFVVPALHGGLGPDEATRLIGCERAERLFRLVGGSADAVFELIRRLGIDCSPEQTGVLQPAPTARAMQMIERKAIQLAKFGLPVDTIDAHATAAATGVPGYLGAMRLPTGGQINPLAYAAGLAACAGRAGARLMRGKAAAIERVGASWRVTCSDGIALGADRIVLTTNALVGNLVPLVRRSIVPMRLYQVATQVMDESIRARILPQRQPLVDLRHHPFALRWSPDNRLITGGGSIFHGGNAVARMERFFVRRLQALVPDLPPVSGAFSWYGVIAGTGDFIPRCWSLGPGLLALIGCNGRGVALTTVLGREVGRQILGAPACEFSLPVTEPRAWKLHGLMRFAPSAWLARARLNDWLDDRSRR
jgi:glycine/D-amino acid oxidase-like deaminating enzyme